MAIELITGNPGAGKTCYAVSQRIVSEIGREVTVEDDIGQAVVVKRRVVIAGVRGLKAEHERLPHTLTGEKVPASEIEEQNRCDAEGEPVHKRLPGDAPHEVEASLFNWWRWCKPGDLIVCDEIQYIVPRGTLNKKPPFYIQALEIHRHYGVDFLFITQHPDFLDPHVRKLVGLHRHVRSVMGSALCTLYTWDHASSPERFNLANKGVWVRRGKHFALYKSAVAHVKPPTSGRSILVILPLMFAISAYGAWSMKQRLSPEPVTVAAASASAAAAGAASAPARPRKMMTVNGVLVPKLTGCYATSEICGCIGEDGWRVKVPEQVCRESASTMEGMVEWEPRKQQPPAPAYGASAGGSGGSAGALASATAFKAL